MRELSPGHNPADPERGAFGMIFAECHINYRSPVDFDEEVAVALLGRRGAPVRLPGGLRDARGRPPGRRGLRLAGGLRLRARRRRCGCRRSCARRWRRRRPIGDRPSPDHVLARRRRNYPRLSELARRRGQPSGGSERPSARRRPARRGPAARSWPEPDRARPACSPTASPTWWARGRPAPARSWPSPSPTRPRRRCASGCEALVGRKARAMWVMTFHSACARILRADAERLGYTRGFTIYDEQDTAAPGQGRAWRSWTWTRSASPPRGDPAADLRRQEPAARRRGLPAQGRRSFFEQTAADVYAALRAADAQRRTPWTSTTCSSAA